MSTLDLRSIAVALGGDVTGGQVSAPGPGHSRNDRSLTVRLASDHPSGFVCHSHAGDDWRQCRDHVAAALGIASRGPSMSHVPTLSVPSGLSDDEVRRIGWAVAIWDDAVTAHGSLVERYLASRGLTLPPGSLALRYHPRCPWKDKATGQTLRVPAMVAAMRRVSDDALVAVHRTRLTDDGRKVDRMMLGLAAGAAIKIDADDDVGEVLAVGEGIETCLAARQMGITPAWAMGSTSNIGSLPALDGIARLVLIGERDGASRAAGRKATKTWVAAGRDVDRVEPTTGNDMNDALMARVEHVG